MLYNGKNYNLNSIGDLFELRKIFREQFRNSLGHGNYLYSLYFVRLICFINNLIHKKGYK